jgi:uncharacterized protein (TIGR03437 family)
VSKSFLAAVLVLLTAPFARAVSTLTCQTTAVPLIIHAEGITEAVGDLQIYCSGGIASQQQFGSVTLNLNVDVTNRIDAHDATDIVFTIDSGAGPVPGPQGVLVSPTTVAFDGANLQLSPTGTIALRFSNVRVNATQTVPSPGGTVVADISISGTSELTVNQSSILLGTTFSSLYSNFSSALVCAQSGATVPALQSFSLFLAAHAEFNTTRITEGYVAALAPKADVQNFNADTGDRVVIRYTGLSPLANLFVPVAVAGSDAVQPTAGGDFGVPASGGEYAPSANIGSLLLSLVTEADANGVGGTPLFIPPSPPSPVISFDALAEVPVASDGSAYAVYEVMDSSDSTMETAQFPTFLSVPPSGSGIVYTSSEQVMIAPVSTVMTASITAPVPRFVQTIATNDCAIVGDCSAVYFPHLTVSVDSLNFTESAGLATSQLLSITNTGEGSMTWTSSIVYVMGTYVSTLPGWLSLNPSGFAGDSDVTVVADATSLAPGTWNAIITINAGPVAGSAQIPITLTVTPSAGPSISSVTSSANFYGPMTAGSLGTIIGANFTAPVTVTVGGLPAQILFSNNRQVNLLVPAGLAGQASTQVVVSNNGVAMAPVTVPLAPFSPGIFPGAILNQDNTVNSAAHPAPPGTVVQMWGTGISATGVVTGLISGQLAIPQYAGPAPDLPGVQQVNLPIPGGFAPRQYFVQICEASSSSAPVCSPPAWVVVGQ